MSDSLQLHGLQHARLLCPSLPPGVCSNSCPLHWWCYLTISSSAALFFAFNICTNIVYLSFSFWLTSLYIIGSRFIHLTRSESNMFLLWLSNIPFCMHTILLYQFICQWSSRLLPFLAIVNSAVMNSGVHIFFQLWFPQGIFPGVGLLGHFSQEG